MNIRINLTNRLHRGTYQRRQTTKLGQLIRCGDAASYCTMTYLEHTGRASSRFIFGTSRHIFPRCCPLFHRLLPMKKSLMTFLEDKHITSLSPTLVRYCAFHCIQHHPTTGWMRLSSGISSLSRRKQDGQEHRCIKKHHRCTGGSCLMS